MISKSIRKKQVQRGKACLAFMHNWIERKPSKFSYFVLLLDWLFDRYRRMNNFHRFSINFILAPWFFYIFHVEFQGESILCVTLTRLCINYMPFHHVSVLWVKWHEVVSEQIEHAWKEGKIFCSNTFQASKAAAVATLAVAKRRWHIFFLFT